jgi:hypothetical protein
LYCIGLCLDVQVKTYAFHGIIEFLYEILDFDANSLATVRQLKIKKIWKQKTIEILSDMYNLYAFESSSSRFSQINTISRKCSSSSS